MATTKHGFSDLLVDAIRKHIESETNAEIDNLIADTTRKIESRRREIVAATLISVMKLVDFKMMQDRIVFTVRELPSDNK